MTAMMMRRSATWLFVLAAPLLLGGVAFAQLNTARPAETKELDPRPHFNAQVPLDTKFMDSGGREISLAEVFDGTKPVLLTMNYSDCPMLCSLQLDGLVEALKKMPWTLGNEYRVLTISIDPKETPQRAQLTKEKYLQEYGRSKATDAWRFVVGSEKASLAEREASIRRVADAIGFQYRYLPDLDQYSHAALLTVCTPEGRVAQYYGGVEYNPKDLRLALLDAGKGKVGSAWDQVLLFCFHYDPQKGSYALQAWRLMQIASVVGALVVGTTMGLFWRREVRRRRQATSALAEQVPA